MLNTKNVNPCFDCKAHCCREVAVSLGSPKTKKDWDEIKWLVSHKNINVYKDNENDWLVEFQSDCKYLDENNRCKIYSKRPDICSGHKNTECIIHGEEEYYKIIFYDISDVEKYLEKKNFAFMKKK